MTDAFDATLTPAERHLVRRLEGFGDVVFGFTISQLAFQFAPPRIPSDLLDNPLKYVIYGATFALIALLWIRYHRLLTLAFRPRPLDLALLFTFLAFTGLVPYAMNANVRFVAVDYSSATYGFGAYMICAIGTQTTSTLLAVRGFARAARYLGTADALDGYRQVVGRCVVAGVFVVQFAVDVVAGPAVASLGFPFLWFVPTIVRRRIRTLPAAVAGVTAGVP